MTWENGYILEGKKNIMTGEGNFDAMDKDWARHEMEMAAKKERDMAALEAIQDKERDASISPAEMAQYQADAAAAIDFTTEETRKEMWAELAKPEPDIEAIKRLWAAFDKRK